PLLSSFFRFSAVSSFFSPIGLASPAAPSFGGPPALAPAPSDGLPPLASDPSALASGVFWSSAFGSLASSLCSEASSPSFGWALPPPLGSPSLGLPFGAPI